MSDPQEGGPPTGQGLLDDLQLDTFQYFQHEVNPRNGLVCDKAAPDWPASIAAVGLALAAYPVGVERGWLGRPAAIARTLATLRFFHDSPQGPDPAATGYRGFYYHFLDMETGRRAWQCELSVVDTLFFLAGALVAATYFDADTGPEREIRERADALYRRAEWDWALNGGTSLSHGWKPESGFLPYRWEGYDEALLLYMLALGSPTHPIPAASYPTWAQTYAWKQVYGLEYLYAAPLFIHQLSHIWIDFRGIQDAPMRAHGSDYFENSRRATLIQQRYAIENPQAFRRYGEYCWGITASDGPGTQTRLLDGIERRFFGYEARGAPFGLDDGTLAPWAVVASLPFAPEIVLPTIQYLDGLDLRVANPYGFKATFNPTYPAQTAHSAGWISPYHIGINQGPVVLMIENYRTEMIWQLMRQCPYLVAGLRRAGFSGGWLASTASDAALEDS